MPKLVRLYIVNVLIGFGLAAIFTGLLIWLDVANLRHLILGSGTGLLAGVMLVVFNGIVFASVQFAIAVMRLAEPQDPPRRGGMRILSGLRPVRSPAAQRKSRLG